MSRYPGQLDQSSLRCVLIGVPVALLALGACPSGATTAGAGIPLATPALTLPLSEVSGLASAVADGEVTLLAVGDEARTLIRVRWGEPLDLDAAERIALPLPERDGGSQLEAVAVDGAGLVYVLDEAHAQVNVLAITAGRATLRHRYDIVIAAPHPLAKGWAKRPNKRGEGLVVLPGGHLLVAKQANPKVLIELGPAGDAPAGVTTDATPPRPPLPPGPASELVPLAVWELAADDEPQLDALSDLARGPDGALYLIASRPHPTIARVRLPLAPDGREFALADRWPIAVPVEGKAEGLAFGPGGRVAVGLDAKGDAPNLLLLAPLP